MKIKKTPFILLIYLFFSFITVLKVGFFNKITQLGFGINTALTSVGIIFIISFVISLLELKHQVFILQIMQVIISVILLFDLTYFTYFKDFISIFGLENIKNIPAVSSSVGDVFKIEYLVLFLDLIVYILLSYLYKKEKIKIEEDDKKYTEIITYLFALSLIGVVFIYSSIYSIRKMDKYALENLYDKKFVSSKSNILLYHMYDIKKFINYNNNNIYISDKNIAEAKKHMSLNIINQDEYFGKYKGKNLLVIQLESAQGFILNKSVNGQEITPNLNKLANENYFVPNFYYQTSVGGTSDAEFAVNTGYIPLSDIPVYYSYVNNIKTTLPKLFKESGYTNYVMHGNDGGFWNRNAVYKSLGFDEFHDISKYYYDDKVMLGLSDESFFKQNIEKINKMQKPFYNFVITLSTHHPYNDIKFKDELNVGEYEGTLIGNYMKAMHYLDKQLGMFLNELEKEGLLKDTVVVLYGDHHGIPYGNKDEIEKFLNISINDEFDWYKLQKTFAIIKTPDNSLKGTNNIVTGQTDLFPTIIHLFGLDLKETFGYSIVQKQKNEIVAPYGLYIYDDYIYLSYLGKAEKLDDKKELNKEDTKKYMENYNDIIRNNNILIKFK